MPSIDAVMHALLAAVLVYQALMILDLKRKQTDVRTRHAALEKMLYGPQPNGYPKIITRGKGIIFSLVAMEDSPVHNIIRAQREAEQALDSTKALKERVELLENSRPSNLINPDELR